MEPKWEDAPAFGRRETLLRALKRLHALVRGPVCIVETGTLRNDSPSGLTGDGWSTVAWAWYCSRAGGRVYTIDIEPSHLEVCRRVTAPYASVLQYIDGDSVTFLRRWSEERAGEIDLLYLDSLDYIDHAASEEHHRAEAEAALPALATPCLVLIDDTQPSGEPDRSGAPSFTGKGARAGPFLLERGFDLEWYEGGQLLLSRGALAPARASDRGAGGIRAASDGLKEVS